MSKEAENLAKHLKELRSRDHQSLVRAFHEKFGIPVGTLLRAIGGEWKALSVLRLRDDGFYFGVMRKPDDEVDSGVTVRPRFFDRRTWKLPPGYRFEGSEVVKVGIDPAVPGSERTGLAGYSNGTIIAFQKPKPACECGATTNLRNLSGATYSRHLCGACYQAQRRAELKAQAKAALDRPLPKSTAPASWPEQFSSPTWED
jgi:hypothetical protein